MTTPTCALIGYGPGLGIAYAETFRRAGYDIALLSRSGTVPSTDSHGDTIARAYSCDAGDLGPIDVVLYNADLALFGTLDEVSEDQFEASWRVGALGLFATAKYLAPRMAASGSGAIIVSGATASLRGNLWTTAFAPSKAAQRILAQSLAKQLGPKGVHVAYIVIDGVIDTPNTRKHFAPNEPDAFFIQPNRIAEAALMLVQQDRSAWTFELDLRPFGEKW